MNRNSANQYNPDIAEYNRLSMPVVSLSWIFIAIAAMGVIYGLASIVELTRPLVESMDWGDSSLVYMGQQWQVRLKLML